MLVVSRFSAVFPPKPNTWHRFRPVRHGWTLLLLPCHALLGPIKDCCLVLTDGVSEVSGMVMEIQDTLPR